MSLGDEISVEIKIRFPLLQIFSRRRIAKNVVQAQIQKQTRSNRELLPAEAFENVGFQEFETCHKKGSFRPASTDSDRPFDREKF